VRAQVILFVAYRLRLGHLGGCHLGLGSLLCLLLASLLALLEFRLGDLFVTAWD
jgi:hypothetical protein